MMYSDVIKLMEERHSVRKYTARRIDGNIRQTLQECADECNKASLLNIQLCFDEPKAFDTPISHYGSFSNVNNYIALVGKKTKDVYEKCGYYGEKLVFKAQELGLNTCWVALTYSKKKVGCVVGQDESLIAVIALGYGAEQGKPHKCKSLEKVMRVDENAEWFIRGVKAAMLAPTAVNQQKFFLEKQGNAVKAMAGLGFYTKLDLGIIKYHFEIAAGKENFVWK